MPSSAPAEILICDSTFAPSIPAVIYVLSHMLYLLTDFFVSIEPQREKTGLRGFRPGLTQTVLYSLRSRLEARIKKKRNCTIRVAKTKALISFAVTAKLICAFVFAYAKCCLLSHMLYLLTGFCINLKLIKHTFCH